MCSKVMVPLDGSPFSEQSLRYAYQVAGHLGAQLHLVKVHMPAVLAGDAFAVNLQIDRVSQAAEEEYLLGVRERYVQTEAETAVLTGPIVDALKSYIDDQGIDLVIMTTHGRGGLSRAWLGSVADQLIRRVNIPILLLRPQKGEATRPGPRFDLDRIVIPLDGSKEAERAIEPAVMLGNLTGARYTLLQVVPPYLMIPISDATAPTLEQSYHEELRADAEKYLNRVAERLRAEGRVVDTAVMIQPQCAAGILEQAATTDASLIAMSTHGRSGWERLALGSVADKVLRGTTVPLLLLRPALAGAAA